MDVSQPLQMVWLQATPQFEAISHGICELMERDATALWKFRDQEKLEKNRLDLASVDEAMCQDVLGRLEGAGLRLLCGILLAISTLLRLPA